MSTRLKAQVLERQRTFRNGLVLSIDPSTGMASDIGYAYYQQGRLLKAGVVEVPKSRLVGDRLVFLFDLFSNKDDFPVPDLILMEQMPPVRSPHITVIQRAIGVITVAFRGVYVLEVPVQSWKARVKKWEKDFRFTYQKSDVNDAIVLLATTLEMVNTDYVEQLGTQAGWFGGHP